MESIGVTIQDNKATVSIDDFDIMMKSVMLVEGLLANGLAEDHPELVEKALESATTRMQEITSSAE